MADGKGTDGIGTDGKGTDEIGTDEIGTDGIGTDRMKADETMAEETKKEFQAENNMRTELAVIGGGPAGMAAAWAAKRSGVGHITVFERNEYPGGILPQCIHNGFGIGIYGQDYTGPEYADIWKGHLEKEQIEIRCSAVVLQIEAQKDHRFVLKCLSQQGGLQEITAEAVIFACGCRERTLGQMRIPGSRPAGIYMAGSAQYMVNICNLKPGKNVAILGFGDIGLIMARRLTLEGIRVRIIFGEQANGLVRNYIQCVREFGIESRVGYTLLSTHGYRRLRGITIAPKTPEGKILSEQKEYIYCDTLLVAAGLVPEDELFQDLVEGAQENGLLEEPAEGTQENGLLQELVQEEQPEGFFDPKKMFGGTSGSSGIPADGEGRTPVKGVFACGNVTKIADLVDKVTMAGIYAGCSAAGYLGKQRLKAEDLLGGDAGMAKQAFSYHPAKMEGRIPDKAQFVCTVCPNGCAIQPKKDGFTGQKCVRGIEFARNFLASGALKTVLSTTVKVKGGGKKLLAVRMNEPLASQEMFRNMPAIQKILVTAPVKRGQVVWRSDHDPKLCLTAAETIERKEE